MSFLPPPETKPFNDITCTFNYIVLKVFLLSFMLENLDN
jgi:hypothetical protein